MISPGWSYLVPALFGLGMGSASPALTAWMLKQVPPEERAVAINTFSILSEGAAFLAVGWWELSCNRAAWGRLSLAALLAAGLAIYQFGSRWGGQAKLLARSSIANQR